MDELRIIDWWHSHPRKPANIAFTEGEARTVAYFMELALAERMSEVRESKNALSLCASMAGNPDAAEGCRKIISFVKKYVGDNDNPS